MSLDGQARKQLRILLAQRWPTYQDFRLFLVEELDRQLADYSNGDRLPQVLADVITSASAEGWLADLVDAAARESPHIRELQLLATIVTPARPAGLAAANVVSYDLHDHVRVFRRALYNATENLVGVAVPCGEPSFLNALHLRLAGLLRGEGPRSYSMSVTVNSPAALLDKLCRLRGKLQVKPVVAAVGGIGLPEAAELATALWTGLATGPVDWPHHLVVVFSVDAPVLPLLPSTVHRLPAPRIDKDHLIEWVAALVDEVPQPAWSRRLVEKMYSQVMAADESDRLYTLYAELQDRLDDLSGDWDAAVAALAAA